MSFEFNRENLDHYLYLVAKGYKKHNKKKTKAELILVGGSSIVINYGFRGQTTDIDSIILAASYIKDVIAKIADENGLEKDWLNDDFKKTSSYSDKLIMYGKHYKTFCRCLDVRTIEGECLIAMKLRSFREYKHDISDIVGIMKECEELGQTVSKERISAIYRDLYNADIETEKMTVLESLFSSGSFEELYYKTVDEEAENKAILIEVQQKYKKELSRENASEFLKRIKEKKKAGHAISGHQIHTFTMPLMNSNMFILTSGRRALIVDPCISEEAERLLSENAVDDITVVLTHEHYDHISGVNRFKEWILSVPERKGCKVYAGKACAEAIPKPSGNLSEFFMAMMIKRSKEEQELAGEIFDRNYSCTADVVFTGRTEFEWEDLKLVLIETPGHSPGSICVEIYGKDDPDHLLALVTGDSLVQGNKVITRLPRGDKKAYREITLPYLQSFPDDTLVLPGHGEISYLKDLEL